LRLGFIRFFLAVYYSLFFSDLARQSGHSIIFPKNGNSWVILSDIEQRIKQKIEAAGTPLKNWDIKIYRGILTGCNDAFIINREKRDELIKKCPKSVEIIRPILRGRDIKRYGYDFAELYLIATFPSKKYNIDDYPAIKDYLLNFGKTDNEHLSKYGADCWGKSRLEQSGNKGSRKKTHNKWFELQDSIAYWDDFSKPKIIYPNMTKYLPFLFDDKNFFVNQKCFIITGKYIGFLTAFFNSSLFKYCFRDAFPELQGGTRELSKIFFENIPVVTVNNEIETYFLHAVKDIQNHYTKSKAASLDKKIFELYKLDQQEQNEIGFREIK